MCLTTPIPPLFPKSGHLRNDPRVTAPGRPPQHPSSIGLFHSWSLLPSWLTIQYPQTGLSTVGQWDTPNIQRVRAVSSSSLHSPSDRADSLHGLLSWRPTLSQALDSMLLMEVLHWTEKRRVRAQGQEQNITYQYRPLSHKPLRGLGPQATSVTWTDSAVHRISR